MSNKLDKADIVFSKFIRLRDFRCKECGQPGLENADGEMILGLECSHFYIRSKENVRFDPKNTDSFCHYCHNYYETHREKYKEFKINQLGLEEFEELRIRSEIILDRVDRKKSYRIAKKLYDDIRFVY